MTGALTRDAGENAGGYAIRYGTLAAVNYSIAFTSAVFTITPRVLTVSANVANKVYDGTTAATATLTLGNAAYGETPTATFAAAFRNKVAGTGKAVDVTAITLTPAFAGNYTLNGVTVTTAATISPKAITGTFTAADKVYDGGTGAIVTGRSLSGAVNGDSVALTGGTAAFANKAVGTNKVVSLNGATLAGSAASNYTLSGVTATTASISKRTLDVTATAADKVYDGTTAAATLSDNRVTGDQLVPSYAAATFNTPDVGTNKPVTASGISLTGADAGNYTANTTAITTAAITPMSVTIGLITDRPVAVPGLAITFTATVAATGTVTFKDGSTVLGSAAVVNGVARLTTDTLTLGNRTVSASLTGGNVAATPASVSVSVVPVAILADPLRPGQNALYVGGTPATDVIGVDRCGTSQYVVGILSLPCGQWPTLWAGTFSGAISRVVIFGGDGDDALAVDNDLKVDAWQYGGNGNDTLIGGGGNDVLKGGVGNDFLTARGGRDILVGGAGADTLVGDNGDDLLIGGSTTFDATETALWGVQLEWTSTRNFATRVANLRGTGTGPRANGTAFLMASGANRTVLNDSSADCLKGGRGRDWYFANVSGGGVLDSVTGLNGDDVLDDFCRDAANGGRTP